MSLLYNPNSGLVNATRYVPFLSQRDLSIRIPVNYVTYSGVVLKAACFANDRYEEVAAATCFSNLLAAGFRRLEADVYWDVSRSHWSLCPVQLGGSNVDALTTSTSMAATSLPTAGSLPKRFLSSRAALVGRQGTETLSNPIPSTSTGVDVSSAVTSTEILGAHPTSTAPASMGSSSDDGDGTVVQSGSYVCSRSTDLALLISIITAHLAHTGTDLNATTITLSLNVHAAVASSDPGGSAQQPLDSGLPGPNSSLSSIIASNASAYMYTPTDLSNQRSDLNSSRSWFAVGAASQPDAAFFDVEQIGSRVFTTDGWPSESYVELQQLKRLLVGFGEIDPQMANYNFSGDDSSIFPSDYLESVQSVTFTNEGNIASGCFFESGITNLADVNSSWAVASVGNGSSTQPPQLDYILDQSSNFTLCGISPILNYTLNDVTADADYRPYQSFVESSIWSWGIGQPMNNSPDGEVEYHCAALNYTSGFWQTADCTAARLGACRVGNEPYSWRITDADGPYARVDVACGDHTTFDTPRTALENTYLLAEWRSYQFNHSGNDDLSPLLWLNFNDFDVTNCWVVGQNSTCPYGGTPKHDSRTIIVPVVGAVVVFVLTALTILVKCAGNRQTAKRRRRRGDDGGDYEGVPS